ncbi:MAG TPA: branched-chain amino acid ABC transporter permease [Candidatus Deferrimicrobiaceae bacterium]|nr:branched-chain amino acid ABC transporter permease [Candidatus Deferrimicrobiaceae bacterium]
MEPAESARAGAAPRRRWWLWSGIVGALLVVWPLFVREPFFTYIATLVLLYAIGAASLHLVLRIGHLSLCHAAFMGLGGYTSALLTTRAGWPFALAFLASGLVPAAVALIVGPIVLRLRGVYFVLITFTLGEVIRLVFNEWQSLTGGADGIFRIPPPHPFLADKRAYYYFALVMAALCVGGVARLLASQTGRYVDAIREGERLAQSSGVPVLRFKVLVFAIACGLVGLQGSLLAHFIHFIAPGSYTFNESLNLLVMNVIGGMGSLTGPLIGAAFLTSLPEFLRGWVELQRVLYGIVLIVLMLFVPGGLTELGRRLMIRSRA